MIEYLGHKFINRREVLGGDGNYKVLISNCICKTCGQKALFDELIGWTTYTCTNIYYGPVIVDSIYKKISLDINCNEVLIKTLLE